MTGRKDRIRVGMISADKRALWYGALFDEIDPEAYAALDPEGYHHLTYYSLVELKNKRAEGFQLAKVYDEDREAARQMSSAFGGRPDVCRDLEDVSEEVDLVLIANAAGEGADHLRLAMPGLQKGVPTFIDRPFASTVDDAKALIRVAQRKRTPLLSCSHLRMLPQVERFKLRFGEIEPIERGVVHGHGPNPADIADGIELALVLFGDEFAGHAADVQSMGAWPLETVLVTFTQPRTGRKMFILVANTKVSGVRHTFHASASSDFRPIYLDDLEAFVQSEGGLAVMNAIGAMVRTGKPPISYGEMLQPVAVMEAARRAHNLRSPKP